jgi:dihydrofolate reductase
MGAQPNSPEIGLSLHPKSSDFGYKVYPNSYHTAMKVSIIVAISENRVIGRDGGLPWRLGSDLRRFKELTMGHHLIMGRKTYESLGRPLPGRTMIVLTRELGYCAAAGVLLARDLDEAIALAVADDEVFVIGGAEVYCQALPLADRLYLTLVHADIEGDTYFPEFDARQWKTIRQTPHAADERNQYDTTFRVLDRQPPAKH